MNTNLQWMYRLRSLPPSVIRVKLYTFLLGQLWGRLYIDLNHETAYSLVIASVHRSGSTWLADLLSHQLHYRFIFEPIRQARDERLRTFVRYYLRSNEQSSNSRRYKRGTIIAKFS